MLKPILIIISFICLMCSNASFGQGTTDQVFPDGVWGTYTQNVEVNLDGINRTDYPLIKGVSLIINWKNLEPESGQFEFDRIIGERLKSFVRDDFYCYIVVWVSSACKKNGSDVRWTHSPPWLFEKGVPLVETKKSSSYPYYLDDDYKFYYYRMIDSLGEYLCNLPPELQKRVLFVQSAEGSTGDEGWYKSDPVDPQYEITHEQWTQFRIAAWERYKSALTRNGKQEFYLLINPSLKQREQYEWVLKNSHKVFGIKEGSFSHGFHTSFAKPRLADFIQLRNEIEARGLTFFSRGEMNEWQRNWIGLNPAQGLYWSAIYATHNGLSMWNLQYEAAEGETYADAINFFNKYAAEIKPQEAKGAFCALRRGLDAADAETFPVSIYGKADQKNAQRYLKIVEAFSEYGATAGDIEAVTGGGMASRRRQKPNDVGWEILAGNWQRHLTQIDPEETSVAWWQVDKSIYGRFARGFDPDNGKDSLLFDLDDHFFGSRFLNGTQAVVVEVTFRDSDPGSWKLVYDATDGTMKTAMEITNTGSGGWKTKKVTLDDAYLGNRGQRGADFILVNTGGTNCRFHMIAVDKTGQ